MTPDLTVTRAGSAMVLTFSRPEALNAFRDRTFQELRAALTEAEHDDTVRAVVLTGSGRAFCAGVDLAETEAKLRNAAGRDLSAVVSGFQDLTRRLVALPKIVISAVNGIAVGVGAELALASDLRIASESASFAFMEVRRGLYPTNGVLYFLPRIVGHGRAVDFLLTGDRIDAAQALASGLVSRVVPDDALADTAIGLAEKIGAAAPLPVRMIKQHLGMTWESDLETVLGLEAAATMACLRSGDLAEGLDAFRTGRAPAFRGQ